MKKKTVVTKKGSVNHIVEKIYNDLNGKIPRNDIKYVISLFWGHTFGLLKYLGGRKSFSINRMFFFSVFRNKDSILKERNKESRKKATIKHSAKINKEKKKKELQRIRKLDIKKIYENLH